MRQKSQKREFDVFYWLIIAVLAASALYLLDIPMWSDINKSGFPLSSHITSRLAYMWHVFWPAIIAVLAYPFVKAKIWGSTLERTILIPWKLFTLVLISVLWWAFFFGS